MLSGQFLIDSEASLKAHGRLGCMAHSIAGGAAMIARLIRWSIANRFLVLLATLLVVGLGRVVAAAHAARRDARSVGRAGDHPHDLSRARRRRSSRTRSPIR